METLVASVARTSDAYPTMHQPFPGSVMAFRRELHNAASRPNALPREGLSTVRQWAQECKVAEGDIDGSIAFMGDTLGELLHYHDVPALRDTVFTDPQWLMDVMKSVVRFEQDKRLNLTNVRGRIPRR